MNIVMLSRNAKLYSHQRLKEAAEQRDIHWILSTAALLYEHCIASPDRVLQR